MTKYVNAVKTAAMSLRGAVTMIKSAYAGSDWLLPQGLMGSGSSSVVSAGDVDSSSWLSGVTAPPDREHSAFSSCTPGTEDWILFLVYFYLIRMKEILALAPTQHYYRHQQRMLHRHTAFTLLLLLLLPPTDIHTHIHID